MGKVLNVPKIRQLPMYCGPTSLAMVLSFYGERIDQERIGEIAGFDPEEGVYPPNLVRAARSLGYFARGGHNFGLKDIIFLLRQEIPLVARIKSRSDGCGHIVVVRGFNRRDEIYINDPWEARGFRIDYHEFEKIWQVDNFNEKRRWRTKNYGIVVRKK